MDPHATWLHLVRATAAFAAMLAPGCAPSEAFIVVGVKTDFVPGVEVIAARAELEAPSRSVQAVLFRGAPVEEGVRIGELGGLEGGQHVMRVTLLGPAMEPVASRRVVVTVNGATGATVVLTRDCRAVVCPREGDDPTLTECVAGACASERCRVEERDECPSECTADEDCASAAPCAEGRCVDGACLALPRAMGCAMGSYCHPERGCLPLELPADTDAGPRPDAGRSDAGAADAGAVDAGTCCGFATCRTDCTPCGTCGDGSEGVFDPPSDTMIMGGVHRFASVRIRAGVTVDVGGEAPLQILSRGPVVIEGTIELSGADGPGAQCGPFTSQPGAPGRAGGGAGGDTGDPVGRAGAGPVGGGGGETGGGGAGGGGGGGRMPGADGGDDSTGALGGTGGATFDAFAGAFFYGGSGGGGGGQGAGSNGTGGGGGAGGGALLVVAPTITITASGAVRARGGAGGAGGGTPGRTCDSGGGGAGGGGSVWLRGSTVRVEGTIDVAGGMGGGGGRSARGNDTGPGGAGGSGQIRIDALRVEGAAPPHETGAPVCDGTPCE